MLKSTPVQASGIIPATNYTPLPNIQVRRRRISMVDWFHRELKEGGLLARYLAREKGTGLARRRAIAAKMQNVQWNPKSDMRPVCVLPGREFMRLRAQDPHFFADNTNVKNLIRDNPEIAPWKR